MSAFYNKTGRLVRGLFVLGLAACSDATPVSPLAQRVPPREAQAVTELTCTARASSHTVSCGNAVTPAITGVSADVVGGQNLYVRMTSSNVTYDGTTFSFDATITNLMPEALGSPNGTIVDPDGIKVFFSTMPTATAGSGSIAVVTDSIGTFTRSNQPYYQYTGVLPQNATSAPQRWAFTMPPSVNEFIFKVYLSATIETKLVINEVLSNPGGVISDANGEWFEVYNAGMRAVDMQGMLLADSSAAGPRPYNLIASSVIVPPGGYAVFGNTTNLTNNGGVSVNYAYGAGMALANSLDALKIARLFRGDTVTIDYVNYSSAAVSAQNGISRELRNPALNNLNMDGPNWVDAPVTSVYGPGGRGTPGAQNAGYTP